MQKIVITIFVSGILLFNTLTFATQRSLVDYHSNQNTIRAIRQTAQDLREIYGEIKAISDRSLIIHNRSGDTYYPLNKTNRLFCNGRESVWQALTPITSQSFFEAQIFVNQIGEAVVVNGFYYGDEYILSAWRREGTILFLELMTPDGTARQWWRIAGDARLPSGTAWISKYQVVYALYGMYGELRGIYLPD